MKIFITSSFRGFDNKEEIENLCRIVRKAGFEDFCFIRDIEHYEKTFSNSKELMKRAKEEISKCDALLFNATKKSTVRAIEVGIAYSMGKKIIVIMKEGTKIKDTLQGIADIVITYGEINDVSESLSKYLKYRRFKS